MADDLELKNLGSFIGTENYYKMFPYGLLTDGTKYLIDNGYCWFITDALIACKQFIEKETFLVITLKKTGDSRAVMTISDGNNKVLTKQRYLYTDAKRDLELYLITDNNQSVLMLSSEY